MRLVSPGLHRQHEITLTAYWEMMLISTERRWAWLWRMTATGSLTILHTLNLNSHDSSNG